jgi:hypothetical protein
LKKEFQQLLRLRFAWGLELRFGEQLAKRQVCAEHKLEDWAFGWV